MNLSQLFFDRARQFPDQLAVSHFNHPEQALTFEALAGRVQAMAGGMQAQLGVQRGDRVVIWMENCVELVEIMLATWAAGACVVPVNAKLHPKELAYIVNNAKATMVATSAQRASELESKAGELAGATILNVSDDPFQDLRQCSPAPPCSVDASEPAWIFYTSGTTGFPKGVTLTHVNLQHMILAYYSDIEYVAPGQTMVHPAPLSHGAGLYMLPHLLAGGHQVVMPRFDAHDVVQALADFPSVSMFAVPTMINRMVQVAKQLSVRERNISTIIYGGAPMYVNDLMEAMSTFGTRFYQLYGQGETPMTITGLSRHHHALAYQHKDLDALATTGYPRFGVEVRIVDAEGQDLPVGESGEIVVRGGSVMVGYWNNEKATTAALREGWLWTGDIGRLDTHGRLALVDRSKDMILSGGTNIYPREIEEVLLTHPAIFECSVVGRPHADMGEEVVAFIVCHEGSRVSESELDALCLSRMARFKRPREYRFVADLPKSSYGKILKNQLRAQLQEERDTPAGASPYREDTNHA